LITGLTSFSIEKPLEGGTSLNVNLWYTDISLNPF
jgi:hypothetical protein